MAQRRESPSSINTFKQCKRKYYYQYIKKYPTLPNIHQVRGNIAHSTLEKFFDIDVSKLDEKNYQEKLKISLQQLFLHYWQKYHLELSKLELGKDKERFYFEETMLMLMNWISHFLEDLRKIMEKKKISVQDAFQIMTPIREQEYDSPQYNVHGFIDAIYKVEEETHIIDYKTNSTTEFKDSIKLQLAIYSLLYQEIHGKLPDKAGIFFLRHKPKLINVDAELLDLAKKEIAFIHQHTHDKESLEEYPKTVSSLCKWSTGKCDFYDVCKPHEKKEKI